MKKTIVSCLVFLVVVAFAPFVYAAETKNGYPVIKGFYLTMPQSEAESVLAQILSEEQSRFPGFEITSDKKMTALINEKQKHILARFEYNESGQLGTIVLDGEFALKQSSEFSDVEFIEQVNEIYGLTLGKVTTPSGISSISFNMLYQCTGEIHNGKFRVWLAAMGYADLFNDNNKRRCLILF